MQMRLQMRQLRFHASTPSTPSRCTGAPWAPAKPGKAQVLAGGFGHKLETQILVGMEIWFFSVLGMLLVGKKVGAISLIGLMFRTLLHNLNPLEKDMKFPSIWIHLVVLTERKYEQVSIRYITHHQS